MLVVLKKGDCFWCLWLVVYFINLVGFGLGGNLCF